MNYNYKIPIVLYLIFLILSAWYHAKQAHYVFAPPSYHELQSFHGKVVPYPKTYEHIKWRGIYLDDENMFFCDIKQAPIHLNSPRDDNPTSGECDWLGLSQNVLLNKTVQIKAHNRTIYEIGVENTMIFSYEQMVGIYQKAWWKKMNAFVVLCVIGVPVLCVLFHFYEKQLRQKQNTTED